MKHRRRRRIIEVLEAPEILGSLGRLAGRITRLEDIRSSLDSLARYHIRIVVRHLVRVYLLLQVVPVSLVRRRRRCRSIFLTLILHRLRRLCLRRLHRMISTVQGQRYPDDQNANGSYTASEARHQEAVIGRLVRDPTTCETGVKKNHARGRVRCILLKIMSSSILKYNIVGLYINSVTYF